MAQRGRKSTAALAVVSQIPGARHAPPPDLTPEQAEIWRRVVAARPADWFDGGSLDTLAAYCRHADAERRLSALIDAFPTEDLALEDGLARYEKLLAMRGRETRDMVTTARQLRLNPQALYRADAAATAAKKADGGRPWEFEAAS